MHLDPLKTRPPMGDLPASTPFWLFPGVCSFIYVWIQPIGKRMKLSTWVFFFFILFFLLSSQMQRKTDENHKCIFSTSIVNPHIFFHFRGLPLVKTVQAKDVCCRKTRRERFKKKEEKKTLQKYLPNKKKNQASQ